MIENHKRNAPFCVFIHIYCLAAKNVDKRRTFISFKGTLIETYIVLIFKIYALSFNWKRCVPSLLFCIFYEAY